MIRHIFIFLLTSLIGVVMGYIAGFDGSEEGKDAPIQKEGEGNSISMDNSSDPDNNDTSKTVKKADWSKRVQFMTFEQAKDEMEKLLWKPNGEANTRFNWEDTSKLHQLAYRMGSLSPRLAIENLANIPGLGAQKTVFNGIMAGWMEQDLESVVHYYRENMETLKDTGIVGSLAYKWAEMSPEKAWQFVSSLPSPNRREATNYFIYSLGEQNPAQLAKYMMNPEMPDGIETIFKYRPYLLDEWKAGDSEGFEQWKNSLPEDVLAKLFTAQDADQAKGLMDIVDAPDKVAEELKQKTKGELFEYLIPQLRSMEEEMGLAQGLDWLKNTLPEGEAMHALDHRMMTVQPREFAALEKWIQGTSHDRIRARALRELSYSKPLPGYDMSNALDMAHKVGWEDKYILMGNMLNNWVQVDEDAALRWLDSPACPEHKKAQWQKELDKKRIPLIK